MIHAVAFGFLFAFLLFMVSMAIYYEVNKHNLLSSIKESLLSIEAKFDTVIKLAPKSSNAPVNNTTPPAA